MKHKADKPSEADGTHLSKVEDSGPWPSETKSESSVVQKLSFVKLIAFLKCMVRSKRFWLITGAILLFIAVILAVPFTRYKVFGLFMQRGIKIVLQDTTTQRMVSGATVEIDGKSSVTNKDGVAELKSVKVGEHKVVVTKKHYKELSAELLVGLQKDQTANFRLQATGRQVPVGVKNKVGNKPLADVLIRAGDADARTDKDGKAVVVVPADATDIEATFSLDGYNETRAKLIVTESEVSENSFNLTPTGKVYFLSKQSGKIDVVRTNLDGSGRQVVLAGTGKEEDFNTVLLASRDWKYLALLSRRDSGKSKLYLIETTSDKLTTMDEGNASFNMHGWSGHHFVYTVTRDNVQIWQNYRHAIKTFHAESKQLTTLDETFAGGTAAYDYASEGYGSVFVLEGSVVFHKYWQASYYPSWYLDDKNYIVRSVGVDGKNSKTLKTFPLVGSSLESKLYAPNEIVYRYSKSGDTQVEYFEYEDDNFKGTKDITDEKFGQPYPTYLLSPSGDHTLWSHSRDGQNVVFVGNKDGKEEKAVATFSGLTPFGWYSDEYLLASKNGSELYIMPVAGIKDEKDLLKISNYHRPDRSFYGYGGGYGGL